MFRQLLSWLLISPIVSAAGPFFLSLNSTQHVIGNDLWNITIGFQYGIKLYYKNHDLVGPAVGHYVSYNGRLNDLAWNSAKIYKQTDDYLDVMFSANEGDFHWVIYNDLAGAYQYFVNHALPVLGEFRTLFRLDNITFPNGRTEIKDGKFYSLADIQSGTNVQDETWQLPDGRFLTKYDWSTFIRNTDFYGVYGDEFGSWYINAGKDEYNGNHLKQELMVHRESQTGDAVQLNMIHGTHFQALSNDTFADGKVWGPWLWYLNDGSKTDAAARAKQEFAAYPYQWFEDSAYQSRGSVKGSILLSDGRPASGAAVFLGDNRSTKTALDMGSNYYYTTYADSSGSFSFENVRTGTYGLRAWSNGGSIGDVSSELIVNDITVQKDTNTDTKSLPWKIPSRTKIFQIGELDRKSLGFQYGGSPYTHGLVAKCPAYLTYTIGSSKTSDWCFGQSSLGTWTIKFSVPSILSGSQAILTVSLAGWSTGSTISIHANNQTAIGNLSSIASDPSLYRSGTTAGEWHLFEFPIGNGTLRAGANTIAFTVDKSTLWRGAMWDSVLLELQKA